MEIKMSDCYSNILVKEKFVYVSISILERNEDVPTFHNLIFTLFQIFKFYFDSSYNDYFNFHSNLI